MIGPSSQVSTWQNPAAQTSTEESKLRASIQRLWEFRVAVQSQSEHSHFNTPGFLPLARAPELNWKQFERSHIFSDLRYEKLFPGRSTAVLEKRSRMKDLKGESAALFEYLLAVQGLLDDDDEQKHNGRKEFWKMLQGDLEEDFKVVDAERKRLINEATDLGRFEYKYLNNDGKVARIREWLRKGANIFKKYGPEVESKYGYLKPTNFVVNKDTTWEAEYMDEDGTPTNWHYNLLKEDPNRSIVWDEMPEKWGHLRYSKVEKRSMWFLDGERPLAEPPMVLYLDSTVNKMKFDLTPMDRYNEVYPDDPAVRARRKDLEAEEMALGMFLGWSCEERTIADVNRRNFYLNLGIALAEDMEDLGEECMAQWAEICEAHDYVPPPPPPPPTLPPQAEIEESFKTEGVELEPTLDTSNSTSPIDARLGYPKFGDLRWCMEKTFGTGKWLYDYIHVPRVRRFVSEAMVRTDWSRYLRTILDPVLQLYDTTRQIWTLVGPRGQVLILFFLGGGLENS